MIIIRLFLVIFFFSCRLPVTIFDDVENTISYISTIQSTNPTNIDSLHVMTWNIRYGAARIPWFEDSCGDRVHMSSSEVTSHLQNIIMFLNSDTIDILLLQEVDISSKRSAYIDQIQYILNNTYFNYAEYGSMWKSDFIPSGGLGKIDVGVAILSRWPLSNAERIQLPLREDQASYEKYFYLRRCMVKAKVEIPGWDDLYAIDIHAASFSTDDTKQKHIIKYKNILDDLHSSGMKFVTGGDLNAIPPNAPKFDFCTSDQCSQDEHTWHTDSNNDSLNYHRKGSYYNNFQENHNYPSERDLLTLLYNNLEFYPAIPYDERNMNINFTYGPYNSDHPEKLFYDRKLDYLFTNYADWSNTGKTHQQNTKFLSDHIPVSAILYKNK